jgi:two-component sensor histidine kinase
VHNLLEAIAGSLQRNFGRRIVLYLPVSQQPQGGVDPLATAHMAHELNVAQAGDSAATRVTEGVPAHADEHTPAGGWTLPEAESIPIALTLNELITNAIKHSPPDSDIECRLDNTALGVSLSIVNTGRLPEGFRIDHRASAVSGLGLVRSLLPRRHASLHFIQSGDQVIATVTLAAPVVRAARQPRGPSAGG